MSPSELTQYIKQPKLLNESSIIDITLLAEKYPFFQTVQLLRVKNLHVLAPGNIKQALNFTAAYVTDRKILYYLLHPIIREEGLEQVKTQGQGQTQGQGLEQRQETGETIKIPEKEIKDTIRENISDTLTNQKNYIATEDNDEIEFSTSIDIKKEYGEGIELKDFVVRINKGGSDFLELIDDDTDDNKMKEDETKTEVTAPKDEDILTIINKGVAPEDIHLSQSQLSESQRKKNELIDNFIKSNPKIEPNKHHTPEPYDISADSVQENDHLITDTLANIYLKQGHYAKAIFAYEKLCLKYPEKSAYFADQIAEIKKIIEKK